MPSCRHSRYSPVTLILTMGFPARNLLPSLSTMVSSGIVTRLTDAQGKNESMYTNVPFTVAGGRV